MRRKATAKKVSETGARGDANINSKAGDDTALRLMKQMGRSAKTPTGKGLGKAGARRLGQLLKRAIQDQEEPAGKGPASLPKTPIRLFKHHIQTGADNAPETNAAQTKQDSHPVSQLILSMVSRCKHQGGISMAELRQTLAAGGYDVTKNNRRVKVVTTRLVNNETLVRTTRNATFRLNSKKTTDTMRVRMTTVKSPKPNVDLKQSKTAVKPRKGAEKSQRRAIKTTKPRGKSHKPKGKTSRRAAKSLKQTRRNTRKPAGRSHRSREKTPKARRKPPKPAGKKRRSPANRAARVRKAQRKAQRTRRRQPKQNRHLYKYSQKRQPPRRRLPKTTSRLKTQKRQIARRRNYYS